MILTGKTILITGASSGIGYCLTKALAAEKCNLAILSRKKNVLDNIAAELKDYGSNIIPLQCDVRNKEEIKSAIQIVRRKFGEIDIAILNSGVSGRSKVENFNSTEAENTFGVNVLGLIYCVEELLPNFIIEKKGMIVGVSSLADGRGFPKSGFYCASKAAVTKFLESLRVELKKYNVKVITVKPGFVKTPMTDKNDFNMPFLMPPERAAQIILNGVKKEKRLIQFPFPTVLGAKLLRIIPDFLFDKIAART